MYWGIDADWAVAALGFDSPPVHMKNGDYTVTVNIAQTYIDLFGIDPADASATVDVTVQKIDFDCPKCPGGRHQTNGRRAFGSRPDDRRPGPVHPPRPHRSSGVGHRRRASRPDGST